MGSTIPFWGMLDDAHFLSSKKGPSLGVLTEECISAVRMKSLGEIDAARAQFNGIEDHALAYIFATADSVASKSSKPQQQRCEIHIRDFANSVPLSILQPLGDFIERACGGGEIEDSEYDLATTWLDTYGQEAYELSTCFSHITVSDREFRVLCALFAVSGEDNANSVLFSMIRDSRIPKSILRTLLQALSPESGDGALNLLYALGLNPHVRTERLLEALEFDPDSPPADWEFFGTPFHMADLYWLAAARPQTSLVHVKRICDSLSRDPSWVTFQPQYLD
jgi:hypothetical protein